MSFDPLSTDSMFATIKGELQVHGGLLSDILAEVKRTNGRVTVLETDKKISKAQRKLIFAAAGLVGGAVGLGVNLALAYFSTPK